MKVFLKNIIVPSIPLAVFLVGSCSLLWILSFFFGDTGNLPTRNSDLVNYVQLFFRPYTFLSNIVSAAFVLLNAFLIAQINNRFTLIKTRTFLPILTFLLLMSTWSETHIVNGSHISLSLFILSFFYFLNMYRSPKASEMAFMGSFLLGLASIIIHPLVFLIPIFLIGFIIFQSFSTRTFLATLFGISTPWILYLSTLYLLNSDIEFTQFLAANFHFEKVGLELTLAKIIYISSIVVVLVITLFGMFSITNMDAIRTRNNLNFIILLTVSMTVISLVFRNQFLSFLPFLAFFYALIVSYAFTLKANSFYGLLFIVFITINVFYTLANFIFL